jgi:RsiW-degrading membrane proteinase PrsW (M82 family)
VLNSPELAFAHMQEMLHRPTPRFGWYSYPSPFEVTTTGIAGLAWALLAAVPALWLIARVGRRAGVTVANVVHAAFLAMVLVTALAARIEASAAAAIGTAIRTGGGIDPALVLYAPVIEEMLKLAAVGLVLVWARPAWGVRGGMVLGAAAGVGMTVVEVALYSQRAFLVDGNASYLVVLAIRFGLLGINLHAVASAITGAALGALLGGVSRGRGALVLAAGLLAAMAFHAFWNLVASDLMTGTLQALAPTGSDESPPPIAVYLASSAVSALLVAVPVVVLALAWRRSAGRAPDPGEPPSPPVGLRPLDETFVAPTS